MTPEPAIVDFVHALFAAASHGDASVIERHVSTSPSTRLVGSDPEEWLRGGEEIAAFLRAEVTGAAGAVTFTPSETEAFRMNDVRPVYPESLRGGNHGRRRLDVTRLRSADASCRPAREPAVLGGRGARERRADQSAGRYSYS